MRKTIAMSLMLVTTACSSPSDVSSDDQEALQFAALDSKAPQVFVLGVAEGIPAEPVVTFDHVCQGVRYVHALRDSIVLNPDGTAIRSFVIERFSDGKVLDSSPLVARGTWRRMTRTMNVYYFGEGPSIELTLTTEGSRAASYTWPLRLDGSDALTNMSAMGGSCPGSPNDARNAQFRYTRRSAP